MNQPLDADAVLRDDALLDALGRGELLPEFEDDATIRLLLAWREDIADTAGLAEHAPEQVTATAGLDPQLAEPIVAARSIGTARVPEPADEDDAPRHNLRGLLTRRVAVAAAFAAFAAGSLGSVAAASNAEPGSPLWPITKVVYEDHAKSVEAREDVLSLLRAARQAADRNQPDEAKKLLDIALRQAGDVNDQGDKEKIEAQADQVQAQLAAMDGSTEPTVPPTSPESPLPSSTPTPDPVSTPTTEPSMPTPTPSTPAEPQPTPSTTTPTPDPPPSPEPTTLSPNSAPETPS